MAKFFLLNNDKIGKLSNLYKRKSSAYYFLHFINTSHKSTGVCTDDCKLTVPQPYWVLPQLEHNMGSTIQ